MDLGSIENSLHTLLYIYVGNIHISSILYPTGGHLEAITSHFSLLRVQPGSVNKNTNSRDVYNLFVISATSQQREDDSNFLILAGLVFDDVNYMHSTASEIAQIAWTGHTIDLASWRSHRLIPLRLTYAACNLSFNNLPYPKRRSKILHLSVCAHRQVFNWPF